MCFRARQYARRTLISLIWDNDGYFESFSSGDQRVAFWGRARPCRYLIKVWSWKLISSSVSAGQEISRLHEKGRETERERQAMTEKIKMRSFWDIWFLIDLVCFGSVCACSCKTGSWTAKVSLCTKELQQETGKWEKRATNIIVWSSFLLCYVICYCMLWLGWLLC